MVQCKPVLVDSVFSNCIQFIDLPPHFNVFFHVHQNIPLRVYLLWPFECLVPPLADMLEQRAEDGSQMLLATFYLISPSKGCLCSFCSDITFIFVFPGISDGNAKLSYLMASFS